MIPRVKVNYSLLELLNSARHFESEFTQRTRTIEILSSMFPGYHAALTGSGRGALYYLLLSLPQQKVVVPAYTCKAVIEAVTLAGKTIEHVEVSQTTFNMSSDALAKIKLDNDCILLATHQYGIPCDIELARKVCDETGAYLIEDVAAGFGGKHQGRLLGSWGDASFFSFDSTKLLNAPLKAGFAIVRDRKQHQQLLEVIENESFPMSRQRKLLLLVLGAVLVFLKNRYLYRIFHKLNFDLRGSYSAEREGLDLKKTPFYLERFAEWQAYLINQQLRRLESIISKRKTLYRRYSNELSDNKTFIKPPVDVNQEWACIRYPILVNSNKYRFYELANTLGVDFAFSFTHISAPDNMQSAKNISDKVLNIPFYSELSEWELNHSISVLNKLSNEN